MPPPQPKRTYSWYRDHDADYGVHRYYRSRTYRADHPYLYARYRRNRVAYSRYL